MGTIEKRGKNSWRIGTQVQTENGWEWVRDTIHFPGSMTEAKQRKEAEKALASVPETTAFKVHQPSEK